MIVVGVTEGNQRRCGDRLGDIAGIAVIARDRRDRVKRVGCVG
jgi:hypothetical protein